MKGFRKILLLLTLLSVTLLVFARGGVMFHCNNDISIIFFYSDPATECENHGCSCCNKKCDDCIVVDDNISDYEIFERKIVDIYSINLDIEYEYFIGKISSCKLLSYYDLYYDPPPLQSGHSRAPPILY